MWREKTLEVAINHILDEQTKNDILENLGKFDKLELTETNQNKPYITGFEIRKLSKYNPFYGDNRICKCGHTYYRHFDSYEDMDACGCKYCRCDNFEEAIDNE